MGKLILRAVLIIVCSVIGYFLAGFVEVPVPRWLGLAGGFVFALLALLIEEIIRKTPLKTTIGATVGLLVGLGVASLVSTPLTRLTENTIAQSLIFILIACAFGYIGLVLGSRQIEELKLPSTAKLLALLGRGAAPRRELAKVVDTSAIIDGRLADLAETGFLEGVLIVPQFILQELRHIADSPDPLKRARGRRGLNVLSRVQKSPVEVRVVDEDFANIHEVDSKLVALALRLQAKVVTNDYNLNKVARLQGLEVLNINELAGALRPVVLPGEVLSVQIVREGKEPGQGVSYLEDGTMVVVENASRLIGKTLEVAVTSVLQTSAGRMIFASPREHAA